MEEKKGRARHTVDGNVADIKKRDEELNLESVGKAAGFVSGIVKLLKKDKKKSEGR
ncbi:MAG: hypothetical protein MJ171_08600 [Clostridia bacterium]|nr:hypothetical protein [Clostridia bacterium]